MAYTLLTTTDDYLICEGARVAGNVSLGKGVSVWYNAVIRADGAPIVVGENTSIQDCAVLHAGTRIGAKCTIGHNAIVHGCTVGNNVLIGMGAIILTGAKIGDNCIIGAGTLVTGKMDIPAGSMVLGHPGKVVRPLTAEELEMLQHDYEEYQEFSRLYRKG